MVRIGFFVVVLCFSSFLYRFVSYEEYPRDEAKFPGNTMEFYPDYIIGWFLVVNPGTSKRIVEAAKVDSNNILVQAVCMRHPC